MVLYGLLSKFYIQFFFSNFLIAHMHIDVFFKESIQNKVSSQVSQQTGELSLL